MTRRPKGRKTAAARFGIGHFEQRELEASYEALLAGDPGSARLAILTEHRDGHTRNLLTGEDENDIRFDAARLQSVHAARR